MNIIPRGPSVGEIIGQGLSDLATHFAERHMSTKALKGLGFSDAQAKAYAHLGPQVQQQAIHALQQKQQQEASNAAINQILGQGLPPAQQYQQPGAQPVVAQPRSIAQSVQLPHEQQQAAIQQATSIAQNPAFRKLNEQQQQAQALQQQQLGRQGAPQGMPQLTGEQAAILQSQQPKEPTLKEQIEQVRNQKRALAAANLPVNQTIALHQQLENKENELRKEDRENRKFEQKERFKEKELSAAEQREINQETKETYHSVNQAAKAARDGNIRLGRMEQLINEGNVQSNVFLRGLKAAEQIKYIGPLFSIVGAAVTNPETQEFEKLSADFVKDAKQFFGSRVTQNEVELFLKTVPTLMQSAEGQKRVIRNMRLFNEAAELRKKTMNDIIKSNGGKRPQDLEGLIEDLAGPELDALAERFRTGVA